MHFIWDEQKNILIKQRKWWNGIWFEDIVLAIQSGHILARMQNDTKAYWDQEIMIVHIHNYPYKVPYRVTDQWIYLITAYPYSKFTSYISTDA
jgi:isoprenylcysteine carboxyl methyltransferase (ICMT) family protein YpbQ